ncbi:MAG: response regulator [Aggregatilineales bacterium]
MTDEYRILLVEDEVEIAEMLAIFFDGQGFTLFHAPDGEAALSRASLNMPHVILMDITLPDIDGYEVCKRLRQQPRTSHIPIIFLTRRGGRSDRLAGLELGADDFISKPFDLQELVLRVRNSIQRAAREAEIDPRTGLPSARALRAQIETARADPNRAVLEFAVENATPFRDAYGVLAGTDVSVYLAKLIQGAVHDLGHADDSIGYLGDLQYVVLCDHAVAAGIAERVMRKFNANVTHHYRRAEIDDGAFVFQGKRYPLLAVNARMFKADPERAAH